MAKGFQEVPVLSSTTAFAQADPSFVPSSLIGPSHVCLFRVQREEGSLVGSDRCLLKLAGRYTMRFEGVGQVVLSDLAVLIAIGTNTG